MDTIQRRSVGLAGVAYRCVERAAEGSVSGGECLARAEELPVRLQSSGLVAVAVHLDSQAADKPAYAFVRDAVSRGLGLQQSALTGQLLGLSELDRRRLGERARTFAWWLKRACEAQWG